MGNAEEIKLRRAIDMLRKRSPVQARIADEIEARLEALLSSRCTICGGLVVYDGTAPSIEFGMRGRTPAGQASGDPK